MNVCPLPYQRLANLLCDAPPVHALLNWFAYLDIPAWIGLLLPVISNSNKIVTAEGTIRKHVFRNGRLVVFA